MSRSETTNVAIVTGASRGFGRALTAALLERGWAVVVDARRTAELAAAAVAFNSPRLIAIAGDVTDDATAPHWSTPQQRRVARPAGQQRQPTRPKPATEARRLLAG